MSMLQYNRANAVVLLGYFISIVPLTFSPWFYCEGEMVTLISSLLVQWLYCMYDSSIVSMRVLLMVLLSQ